MKIGDLFEIEYPHTLIYSEMSQTPAEINFVSSQGGNNGVVSKVAIVPGIKVYPAGVITVPLKGTVLAAHVQKERCYVAHQIAVLTSKAPMTLQEKLFYCTCIQSNAFRFSYGRQADKTLKDMDIPDTVPYWVDNTQIIPITTTNSLPAPNISVATWKWYSISDLFEVSVSKDSNLQNSNPGVTPYISSSAENNGVTGHVDSAPSQRGNVLTIARNGSVGTTFYQKAPFCASPDDIRILTPKFIMTKYSALFIKTVIELEKFKYAYGRKLGSSRIKKLKIKLPAVTDELPDFAFMESYIKSLPYSDKI